LIEPFKEVFTPEFNTKNSSLEWFSGLLFLFESFHNHCKYSILWRYFKWIFVLGTTIYLIVIPYLCIKTESMKAIEFKSKLSKNRILIPKRIQSELRNAGEKNVRVMILFDDSNNKENEKHKEEEDSNDLIQEELESINNGLKDFEEGKTHSHDSARKLYGKYL